MPNGHIVVFTEKGIWKLNHQTGLAYDSLIVNISDIPIGQDGINFYGIVQDSIVFRVDTSLSNVQQLFDLSSHFYDVYQIKTFPNHQLAIQGLENIANNQYEFKYKIFDTTGVFLDTFPTIHNHQIIFDFEVLNQEIIAVGGLFLYHTIGSAFEYRFDNIYHLLQNITSPVNSFTQTYDLNLNSNSSNVGAALKSIFFDDMNFGLGYCQNTNNGEYYEKVYSNLSVEVKNTGSVPIHSFTIYYRFKDRCDNQCNGSDTKEWTFNSLNIPPNTSIIVFLDHTVEVSSQDLKLCLIVGSVNGKIETDYSDNNWCWTSSVSTKKPKQIVQVSKISPNPVFEKMTVQLPENFHHVNYQIHNAAGQLMNTGYAKAIQNELTISVAKLPHGFYILTCFGDKGELSIGKFIKE